MGVVHQDARRALVDALPALAGAGVLVWWSTDQGGYFQRAWYPGTLLLLGILVAALAGSPRSLGGLPRAAQVAFGAMALFAAWSFLSISWADAPGPAWDAANQALLYLVLFVLFGRTLASPASRAVALGAWTLALLVLAVVVLLKLPGVIGADTTIFAPGLEEPLGYSNANAALWLIALWPALMLAASARVPAVLRGVFAGGVVVLAETSLLSESRGSVVAAGIVLVIAVLVVPGRVRTVLTLLAPAAAIAATSPHTLRIANAVGDDPSATQRLGEVAAPVLLAAVAAGLVVALVGLLERRRPPSEAVARAGSRVVAVACVLVAVVAIGVGLAAAGDPIDRVDRTWHEFKDVGAPEQGASSHLAAGFGGARYDYYRVALDVWKDQPVKGIGAGNFAEDYIKRGTAAERPTSPHSIEFGTLVQTGIVGAVLLALALGAGFVAAGGALRRAGPLDRAVAAGGALACAYWFVQTSGDWLYEFPALAGSAFALLGLAGACAPRSEVARGPVRPAWALGAVAAAAAALSLLAPWAADVELRRAASSWTTFPDAALRQLDRAADYNPLSERPGLLAGTIAVRLGRYDRARTAFGQVIDRDPRNLYATIHLAGLASHAGRRAEALRLSRRSLRLAPQDPVALSVNDTIRKGRISPREVDRRLTSLAAARVH